MQLKHSRPLPRRWPASRLSWGLYWGGAIASMMLGWGSGALAEPPISSDAIPVPSTEMLSTEALSTELNTDEDIPEEILRTEIITGARSPLTGEVLSAAEYAQLQATLAAPAGDTLVSDDLEYLIFLLQFRRAVRPIIPFL